MRTKISLTSENNNFVKIKYCHSSERLGLHRISSLSWVKDLALAILVKLQKSCEWNPSSQSRGGKLFIDSLIYFPFRSNKGNVLFGTSWLQRIQCKTWEMWLNSRNSGVLEAIRLHTKWTGNVLQKLHESLKINPPIPASSSLLGRINPQAIYLW